MPVISSIFLVLSLTLAVVVGSQLRAWTWGPALLALGVAVLAAVPALWRSRGSGVNLGLVTIGILTTAWFAARAWISPVVELNQADLLLLTSAVGAFLCFRAIEGNPAAERILIWGIALLLLASLWVAGVQLFHPDFSPVFPTRLVPYPTGFYSHYNEGANFVIGASMLLAGAAVFGKHPLPVRIFFGLLVVAGMAEVYFSRSRGGMFGAAAGCAVFAIVAMVIAKRRNSKWFAPALIALPLVALAVTALLYIGWQGAMVTREGTDQVGQMLDNIRLHLAGIAVSCIALHPWTGGGSRSYSWECYRFWDKEVQGWGGTRPDLVHNELLQAATDYGIIGAGALLVLLAALAINAAITVGTSKPAEDRDASAWCIGGIAGFTAMFVQSNFSFVFHLVPQTILMGICLGCAAQSAARHSAQDTCRVVSKSLLAVTALLCVAALFPFGVKGTKVTLTLWPTMFGKHPPASPDVRINALTSAIGLWPESTFHRDRATIYQNLARESGEEWARSAEIRNALADYQAARSLHPYDPILAINHANLLSALGRDSEAEAVYPVAVQLQGGMENGFLGNFHFANHYHRKGLRQFLAGQYDEALATLESAAAQIEQSFTLLPTQGYELRVAIHESLGTAREQIKDYAGALEIYDKTCTMVYGDTAHYRAGVLLGRMAVEAWANRKPSDALALFLEAKKRATTSNNVPKDVTPGQRAEYLAYLDRTIKFLEGAKVTPSPDPFR
jgi:O-antigen ligase